ncbi:MAG: hypothetical protein J0M19_00750, partial [Sphingomonadales bacterium]|nr:hypothetical protein [Sphingomonadales bacterium]
GAALARDPMMERMSSRFTRARPAFRSAWRPAWRPAARASALADAEAQAKAQAVSAGADPESVEVVNIEAVPLQYLPGGATRVVCRVVGDLALAE